MESEVLSGGCCNAHQHGAEVAGRVDCCHTVSAHERGVPRDGVVRGGADALPHKGEGVNVASILEVLKDELPEFGG